MPTTSSATSNPLQAAPSKKRLISRSSKPGEFQNHIISADRRPYSEKTVHSAESSRECRRAWHKRLFYRSAIGSESMKTRPKPNFVSLFSGCGGFDIGFAQSGFQGLWACDIDPDAVMNFKANVHQSVSQVDLVNGIPNDIKFPRVDVVIAGPPCQGFSTAGKRKVDDVRNHLLPLAGLLAIRFSPKVVVVENVPGVLAGEHAKYFHELSDTMKEAGYQTKIIKCQTAELGMPQLRRRVLFFAWKTNNEGNFNFDAKPYQALKAALKGVENQKNHEPVILKEKSKDWTISRRILPGQKLSNVRGGGNAVATWSIPEVFGSVSEREKTVLELLRRLRRQDRSRNVGDADPVSHSRLENALGAQYHKIIESLKDKKYVKQTNGGIDLIGTFNGKYRRLTWDKPSLTVDTRFGSPKYFLHPEEDRGFSAREAARIQGFPDSFVFCGGKAAQFRLIGNAVPPPLANFAANIALSLLGDKNE